MDVPIHAPMHLKSPLTHVQRMRMHAYIHGAAIVIAMDNIVSTVQTLIKVTLLIITIPDVAFK